jgi:zinc D-Ala-D-Ala dipeptidase
MGMAAKDWQIVDPDLCMTHCKNLDKAFQKNRDILFDVMLKNDFINYPTEWWHFSYGDRYWAYHKNEKQAIYGSVDSMS